MFNWHTDRGIGAALSYRPGDRQSLGMKVDLRVVDVPFGILFIDPHQRDTERQPGTLIDSTGAGGNPSSGLA